MTNPLRVTSYTLAAAIALACPMIGAARADVPTQMFPFVIPWDDASSGTATDVSFLNAKPAGVNGQIVVKNGHFVEAKTGKRVRFLGTNFTFASNFPTHADAEKIAAHIAKLGINIVRIHHHDVYYGLLWDKSNKDVHKFSADGIDRLDYLIAQFKKNGIYVNLNLHVSREYTPNDGFPASVAKLPDTYDKHIDNLDRHMIDLQKQFAHDYLTRINPYTHLSYTDDPCVAVVEINNENSLVDWSVYNHNKYFQELPEPFRGEVMTQWNAWLAKKYKTNTAMLAAWTPKATANAPVGEVLNASTEWRFEDQSGTGTLTKSNAGTTSSPSDVQITTSQKSDQAWHEQAALSHLTLTNGALYTVSFRAKADKVRDFSLYTGIDQEDWHHVGLDTNTQLTTDWKTYRFLFQASHAVPDHNRLVFAIGNETGSVWLSDVKISPVTNATLLPEGQKLEQRTIDIPTDGTPTQYADWLRFLVETEHAYADEMRTYLRKDLKVKANIVDSQMSYGLLSSFLREADSDFADGHAYWQHPSFPGRPWDPDNWNIKNTPMVSSLADGKGGEFTGLAQTRMLGKPYTISEYNEPAPSDYQSEMFPELATFAAFQDWDIIYGFDYGSYGSDQTNDKINSYFDTGINPAKAGFFPSAALIFRTDAFAPASELTTLRLAESAPYTAKPISEEWQKALGNTLPIFTSRLGATVAHSSTLSTIFHTTSAAPGESSIKTTNAPSGAQYIAVGSGGLSIVGYVGGQSLNAGPLSLKFVPFGNNFASLTLTSIDKSSLSDSKHLLLTAIGKAENTDMVWNNDRTSIGRNWGHGPVQAEGIPATVTLTNGRISHVWALDATGHRTKELAITKSPGKATFTIAPSYQTIWYEIAE